MSVRPKHFYANDFQPAFSNPIIVNKMKTSLPNTLVPLEIRNHNPAWEQMTQGLQGREAFHSQLQ